MYYYAEAMYCVFVLGEAIKLQTRHMEKRQIRRLDWKDTALFSFAFALFLYFVFASSYARFFRSRLSELLLLQLLLSFCLMIILMI